MQSKRVIPTGDALSWIRFQLVRVREDVDRMIGAVDVLLAEGRTLDRAVKDVYFFADLSGMTLGAIRRKLEAVFPMCCQDG